MTSTLPLTPINYTAETSQQPELFLRSLHADWDEARWSTLAHDIGLRYEVIDGILYMSTAPSPSTSGSLIAWPGSSLSRFKIKAWA